MSAPSQKEYLKKYLSGPSKDDKKKKKKHSKIKGQGMKIIDDDVDLSKMRALDDDELDLLGDNEDAPQVAGIVDERPDEVKRLEQFSREKWKVITEDDGFNSSLTVQQISKRIPDLEKSNKSDSDLSPLRNNEQADSDISVERPKSIVDRIKIEKNGNSEIPKSKKGTDSDLSPDRRKYNGSDSDLSPVRIKKESKRSEPKNRNNSDSDLSPPRHKKKLEEPKRKERTRKNDSDSDLSPPRSKRIGHGKDDFYKSRERNRESDLSRKIKQDSDSDLSPKRNKNSDNKTSRNKSPARERNRNQSDLRRVEKDERRVRHRDNYDNEPNFGNKRDFVDNKNRAKSKTDDFKNKGKRRNSSSDSELYLKKEVEVKRAKDRGERKKSRWADPDEELGQQILENISKDKNRNNESKSRADKDDVRKHGIHTSGKRDHREDVNRRSRERYIDKYDSKKSFDDRVSLRVTGNNKGEDDRRSNSRISERMDADNRSTKKMERTLDGKKAGLQDARQLKQETQEFKSKEAELFENLSEELSGRNAKAIKRDLKGKRETEEDRQKQREKEAKDKELEAKYHQWGKGLKQVEEQEANIRDYIHEASKPLARHRDDRDLESALRQKERDGDPMLEYMRRKETEKGTQDEMPARPIYKGPYPPNRFNIRPGHRWDGVDRSNGHEAAVFAARSSKKALDSEQYKWSTEDM